MTFVNAAKNQVVNRNKILGNCYVVAEIIVKSFGGQFLRTET